MHLPLDENVEDGGEDVEEETQAQQRQQQQQQQQQLDTFLEWCMGNGCTISSKVFANLSCYINKGF